MKRLLLTTSAAILALAMASGAAPVLAQNAKDTLVVGMDVDAGTLDPRLSRDTTASRAIDLIYSGLVHITPNLPPFRTSPKAGKRPIRRPGSSTYARTSSSLTARP